MRERSGDAGGDLVAEGLDAGGDLSHAVGVFDLVEVEPSGCLTATSRAATAARLVMSSTGVPRPASSPRSKMSVPPSASTIASIPRLSIRCW
jgi:hypothetical protein